MRCIQSLAAINPSVQPYNEGERHSAIGYHAPNRYINKEDAHEFMLAILDIRPLQVILWFLVHRPHQILFLDFYDFYLIISTTHAQNAWSRAAGGLGPMYSLHLTNRMCHSI